MKSSKSKQKEEEEAYVKRKNPKNSGENWKGNRFTRGKKSKSKQEEKESQDSKEKVSLAVDDIKETLT